MTLRQLEIFLSVVRLGTLSGAAREHGLTQPAVSMQMRSLARELGVELLARRGRRQQPTPAGEALDEYAERILRLVREAETALLARSRGEELVRVAASSTPGVLLPELIAAYQSRRSGTAVRLEVLNSRQVEERVAAGEADFGLVGGTLSRPGLATESWRSDELVLIVGPQHRLAGRRKVRVLELRDELLLARERGSATRASVDAAFLRAEAPPLRTQVLGDTEAIKRAVSAGLGVAIVSGFSVELERSSGTLSLVRVADVELHRPLKIVRDAARTPTAAALEFLAFLRSAVGRGRRRASPRGRAARQEAARR